jgi:hypothetical protein
MTCSERSSCPCSNGQPASFPGEVRALTLLFVLMCFVALALAFATGCTRTVLVSEASPIRTGPCVKGKVYVKTADGWQLGDNDVRIPEGWYCVPPSYVEEER